MRRAFLTLLVCLLRPRLMLLATWWALTGRRVRARNTVARAAASTFIAYPFMITRIERGRGTAGTADSASPLFSVLIADPAAERGPLAATLRTLRRQTHDRWELLIPAALTLPPLPAEVMGRIRRFEANGDAGPFAAAAARATGDWLVPAQAGDRFAADALAQLAGAAATHGARVLYGDCDVIDRLGLRHQPWLKPAWNHEQLFAQDYVSQACAMAIGTARQVAGFADTHRACAPYAMILAAVERLGAVPHHVAQVLIHLPAHRDRQTQSARIAAVSEILGTAATDVLPGPFGTVRVVRPAPVPPPLVSIIVPTRDRLGVLRTCIESLLAHTRYPAFEVIVVDNDSTEADTLAYLSALERRERVRVLRHPGPFNFSAINNFAAEQARGAYLCLLNNDTEVVDDDRGGDWLDLLMAHAVRPEAGAVGPMLLYPDGSIQHAGVVIGMGQAAGHAHRHQSPGEPGYFAQAHVTRAASAVTAACLVVARAKYMQVGGLDAEALRVAYNDVDFCLKLGAAGWTNYYVPHAPLIHHESKSRPPDLSAAQIERYTAELTVLQERWGTRTAVDPLHHPLLDRSSETYRINLQA